MVAISEYTAGSAAVRIFPALRRGFHREVASELSGLKADVKVTPNFTGFRAPQIAPIPVNIRPNLDQSALAGIEAALRALPKVELDANATPAQQKIQELRTRLETLRDKVINLQVSDNQAKMEMALVRQELDRLDNSSATMDVRVDAAAASAALQRVESERGRLDGKTARLRAEIDIGQVISSIATVLLAVNAIDGARPTIRVLLDSAGAVAGLALTAAKVMTLVGVLGGLAGAAGGAIGALGGLGAAGAVAAAGLGPAILAFLGVGKALSAMSAQQDSAGQSAAQSAKQQQSAAFAVENAQSSLASATQRAGQARAEAARSVERAEQASARSIMAAQRGLDQATQAAAKARVDAARSVQRAEQQAARSVEAAERSLASAKQRLAQATRDLARDQRALTSAWEAGRRSLQDLQDQVDGNALDQRQAAFDLADAKKELAEAQATGDPDKIARAQLAYDRQLETIDQLNKQTQRLGVDNRKAQAAGVAGSSEVVAANERIASSQRSVTDAAAAARLADVELARARTDGAASVAEAQRNAAASILSADERVASARLALNQATVDGAQRVADAQREGAQRVAEANQGVIAAQRALQQTLAQTGDAGSAAANKVAQAFANLSPAAAAFARYLFGLKPVLEGLSATAATNFFPPLQRGMDLLLTRLPLIDRVVGQLAAGMGRGLEVVLQNLANPFWQSFFALLGNSAGTVLPMLFQTLMNVAGALAVLITHLMPLVPASLALFDQFAQLVVILAPFIAQLLGGLIPAASALFTALIPLGPLLAALQPILLVLGQAFAMVLGAVLQALTPVLIALTPLIQQLAMAFATSLVNALVALTPFLVQLATFLSQNPALVIGVITALGGLFTGFQLIKSIVAALLGPLVLLKLGMNLLGLSALTVGGMFGTAGAKIGGFIAKLTGGMGVLGLFRTLLGLVWGAVSRLAGGIGGLLLRFLTMLSPVGAVIGILTTLFLTNEQFRGAVMHLLGVLGQLVGAILSAIMPALIALTPVLTVVMNVFSAIASGLATVLVPIIQALAGWIQFITPVLAPLVALFLGIVAAVKAWSIAQAILNAVLAMNPITLLVLAIAALVGGLVWAYNNVTWFRDGVNTVFRAIGDFFTWVWTTLIKPVFDFWVGLLTFVGGALSAFWTGVVQPVFQAIGAFIGWVWTNVIKPPLDLWVWFFQKILGPLFQWFQYLVVEPVMRAIGAIIGWVYNTLIKPVIDGWINVWNTVLFPLIRAFYDNVVRPVMDAVGKAIRVVYDNVVRPVMDAFSAVFRGTGDVVGIVSRGIGDAFRWLGDFIRGVYEHTLKPVIDAVKGGFEAIKGAVDWITNSDPVPPPPGRAKGGLVVPVGYAAGGWVGGAPAVPGFAAGGSSKARPKPGRTDTVPSLLTPGEFVMTRRATAAAGAKTLYGLMALLERKPEIATALAELVGGGRGGTDARGADASATAPAGYAAGGGVGALSGVRRPEMPAVPSPAPDTGAASTALASTQALAGALGVATTAAGVLNPALSALATTQTGLLAPAQAAVTLGQQAMAATVTGVLAPALGVYQQQIGVAAPLANVALQGAQAATQLSTTQTALNTQANSAAMTLATQQMSVATQLEHGLIRNTQLLTRVDTNASLLNTQLTNQGMTLSTQQRSIAAQFENTMIRNAQLLTRQDTDATGANTALRNNEMMASTGLMSATNQNHLANLRGGQNVTTQATTAFADAFRAQMGRTMPDSGNPIKWVINYPIRSITDAWNHLDAQFALGKRVAPYVPNFREGGAVDATAGGKMRGPGTGTSDSILARVSTGEYVMPAARTSAHLPFLEALRSGQPEAVRAAGGRHANPRGYAAGGVIEAQRFAQAQRGKPYVWGAVGPGGYDCSGLMSAVVNVARGQAPHRRLGTAGSFPWAGFTPGLTSALAGGASSGHIAGTIGGTNFEARQSGTPVLVGGGAAGADSAQFPKKASLPMVGGRFVSGGPGGGGAGFDPGPIVDAAFAKAYREIADVPKFFGPSAQVGRDQGVARKGADGVKSKALAKLQEMFAASGMGPLGAGAPFYVREISRAAKARGLGVDGATIGVATAIVETGLKMYANRSVPASLRFPHDAVGSDHDSVGLFQQRQAGWGTIEQRMNAFGSASLFFNKLASFDWRRMAPGAAAQKVQVSAFPGRYAGEMGRARGLVGTHGGAFDLGGPLAPGLTLAYNGTGLTETILDPIESKNYHTLGQLLGRGGMKIDGLSDSPRGPEAPMVGTIENHFHRAQGADEATKSMVHALRVVVKKSGG